MNLIHSPQRHIPSTELQRRAVEARRNLQRRALYYRRLHAYLACVNGNEITLTGAVDWPLEQRSHAH